MSWLHSQTQTPASAGSWAWTPARGRPLSWACSRLTPSLLGRLLLPTQAHPLLWAWVLVCVCVCVCTRVRVLGMWVGCCEVLKTEGPLSTHCATHTEPPRTQPGLPAQPSFPEPLQPLWLPPQADSRRMVLLRLPRAQAASLPPSLSPGTSWAGLQPWELRLLLLFFFSFETSLYDSMKCPLLSMA